VPDLNLTRQRQVVLEVVMGADRHLTAQEIYDRVRQILPGTAYATVYNALAYLVERGLIQEVRLGEGPALYDRNASRHDHLVCRRCRRVVDHEFPDLADNLVRVAEQTGFQVERAHVVIEGLCPECQATTPWGQGSAAPQVKTSTGGVYDVFAD
jgi:Fe2+ or Zn2+ uptake regulation protein